jgi:DNA-binding HxlR family transcriptional regulator
MPDRTPGRLVSDQCVRIVLGALAAGPLQPSALEQLAGVAHSTLYARLASLIRVHMIAKRQLSEFPPRVAYRLTDIGRVLYARALLMDREQKRMLAAEVPEPEAGLPALVGVLAPVARMPADTEGVCMLAEESPAPPPLAAWLCAAGGSIVTLLPRPAAAATASASGGGRPGTGCCLRARRLSCRSAATRRWPALCSAH